MRLKHVSIAFLSAIFLPVSALAILPAQPVTSRPDQANLTGQKRPLTFRLRAETLLDDGSICAVGDMPLASTQPPLATVLHIGKDGVILWNQTLSVRRDVEGSKALHCTAAPNGSLYVTIQTEHQSPYASPIGGVTVAKLDGNTGYVRTGEDITLPNGPQDDSVSIWVSPSPDALLWQGDHLALTVSFASVPDAQKGGLLIDFRKQGQTMIRLDADARSEPSR